ncbi:MAG TPA: glycosyltransferase family 39 protein [bacterium]|nr:glycosyltransferase family 39 protein [bacterium]
MLLVVLVGSLLLFTYGLGTGDLWEHDEPTYTQAAREMLRTRDPFTLYVNGQPWFDKPPLFMWLQALTGSLFGFTTFVARIWSAIFGTVAVAATFLIGRLLYGQQTGLLASLILATTMQFIVASRIAVLDPILLAFMLLAFYMYLVSYHSGSPRAQVWAWVWAGVACLAKGPIGLVLPTMAVATLWAVRREWWRWRQIPAWGPVLFAVIGLSWYGIETVRHGGEFLRITVGQYMFGRVFGVIDNQPGPPWYYFPVLLAGGFPWAAFFASSVVYAWRHRRDLAGQVLLAWVGVPLVFFSLAGTKTPAYILPIYPFLAIGVARLWHGALDGSLEEARLLRWAFGLICVGVAAALIVTAAVGLDRYPLEVEALRMPLFVIAAILAGGQLVALLAYVVRRGRLALAAVMLTPVFAMPVLVHHTLPAVESQRTLPRIARTVHELTRPGDHVAALRMPEIASLIYYGERPVIEVRNAAHLDRVICLHSRLALVTPEDEYEGWVAARLPRGVMQEQGRDGGYRILFKSGPTRCEGDRPVP